MYRSTSDGGTLPKSHCDQESNPLLNTPFSSNRNKYTTLGVLFGCLFPIVAMLIKERYLLLYIIDTAPFFLGLFAYLAGVKQDKIQDLYQSRIKFERSEHETQLDYAEKLSKFGTWELDLETFEGKWSNGNFAILGIPYQDPAPSFDTFLSILHPDDRAVMKTTLQEAKDGLCKEFEIEFRILLPDGKTMRWIKQFGAVIQAVDSSTRKLMGIIQDITTTALAEQEVRFYKSALDQATIVAVTDPKGTILYANEAFSKISGYSKEELIGQNHRILNSRMMGKDFFINMWRTISTGKTWRGEICNRAKNGQLYWVDTTIVPTIDSQGRVTRYTAIRYEITAKKQMEAELIASKEAAISATKTKSAFLANMSHEIRTPMNGIIGMTDLILGSIKDPIQVDRLKIIKNCSTSLLDLINDVLDFSKLEVGKVELEMRPFDLDATTKEVVELFSTRASEKGITIAYNKDFGVPKWISGDATRFRQILSNLISNAVKFTELGRVDVMTSADQLESGKWQIQVAVKDTGIGIAESVKDKLFESFSQADASTTRRFGGSGLGLAISKGICERMGGTIWVDSEVGHGSTFSFSFQADTCAAPRDESQINPFATFDPKEGRESRLRILVAEDNRVNQLVVIGMLVKLGYEADLASNGQEALNHLEANHYDLVFMDCHMPIMDGFETTKQIIARCSKEHRPKIVALTASTMKADVDRCFECGMDDFISKPVTVATLAKVLSECRKNPATAPVKLVVTPPSGFIKPAFDQKAFMANFERMEDLAINAVASFLDNLPAMMRALETAVESKVSAEIEMAAHTLKGALSNFHAEPAQLLAWKLEQLGHSNNITDAEKILADLKMKIEELKKALIDFSRFKEIA